MGEAFASAFTAGTASDANRHTAARMDSFLFNAFFIDASFDVSRIAASLMNIVARTDPEIKFNVGDIAKKSKTLTLKHNFAIVLMNPVLLCPETMKRFAAGNLLINRMDTRIMKEIIPK